MAVHSPYCLLLSGTITVSLIPDSHVKIRVPADLLVRLENVNTDNSSTKYIMCIGPLETIKDTVHSSKSLYVYVMSCRI
jgi:hypothetical protein